MRVHIYSQELTDEVTVVETEADTGITYYGIRFWQHSSERLHHTHEDDDRSAVTFWVPNARGFGPEHLAGVFEQAASLIRNLPPVDRN